MKSHRSFDRPNDNLMNRCSKTYREECSRKRSDFTVSVGRSSTRSLAAETAGSWRAPRLRPAAGRGCQRGPGPCATGSAPRTLTLPGADRPRVDKARRCHARSATSRRRAENGAGGAGRCFVEVIPTSYQNPSGSRPPQPSSAQQSAMTCPAVTSELCVRPQCMQREEDSAQEEGARAMANRSSTCCPDWVNLLLTPSEKSSYYQRINRKNFGTMRRTKTGNHDD